MIEGSVMVRFIYIIILLFVLNKLPATQIRIINNGNQKISAVKFALPFDTLANAFIVEKFQLNQDTTIININNTKVVGVVLFIQEINIDFSLYIIPNDTIDVLFIDEGKNISIRSSSNIDYVLLGKNLDIFTKKYLDFFLFKKIDGYSVYDYFSKENNILRKTFETNCKTVTDHYVKQSILTLLGSLYRKNLIDRDENGYLNELIKIYDIKENIYSNLSNYSFYYFTSYLENFNLNQDIRSEYYQDHQFLFNITDETMRSYILKLQFILGIDSKIPSLLNSPCQAFSDIQFATQFKNERLDSLLLSYAKGCF